MRPANIHRVFYFYPRSPCGERHSRLAYVFAAGNISIHALLAESDILRPANIHRVFYFYPRSPCGERHGGRHSQHQHKHFYPRSPCGERRCERVHKLFGIDISIHALLAESDPMTAPPRHKMSTFLSTLSLRRATVSDHQSNARRSYFYPRSPCGERHSVFFVGDVLCTFLSTLSLRRATYRLLDTRIYVTISIHALLAESDPIPTTGHPYLRYNFYPRSPCGERPADIASFAGLCNFYPRSPCGERPQHRYYNSGRIPNFYPRSPCGERLELPGLYCLRSCISIHALLAESDLVFHAA